MIDYFSFGYPVSRRKGERARGGEEAGMKVYYYTRVRRRGYVKENVVVDKYTSEIITTTERLSSPGSYEKEGEREKESCI